MKNEKQNNMKKQNKLTVKVTDKTTDREWWGNFFAPTEKDREAVVDTILNLWNVRGASVRLFHNDGREMNGDVQSEGTWRMKI